MIKNILLIIILFSLISCSENDKDPLPPDHNTDFITGADISSFPEIATYNPVFYDMEGKQKDFLNILKESGINTIRLRLWVNPVDEHSGFNEVKQFSRNLRSRGFKIWLTLHYSDTWADPGHQKTPKQWQGIRFSSLKDSVYAYTEKAVKEIQPEYIQIGNEINSGFLHPYGHITKNYQQFKELMDMAILAVRTNAGNTRIMIHFAGIKSADWFFDQVKMLDYDLIGLSYYPKWHGKSLNELKITMQELSETYHKQTVIAETAYPFTLQWNDMTHNIVGLKEQLILPEYPATPEGQKKFIKAIKALSKEVKGGLGFCYWGAELIA